MFKDIKWEIMQDYFPTMRDTAKSWASLKFIFLPTGSNCAKVYFMHPGTVMCVAEADRPDYSPMKDAAAIGVFSRWFEVKGMQHFHKNVKGWNIDVLYVMENIQISLYVLKNKRWPSNKIHIQYQ